MITIKAKKKLLTVSAATVCAMTLAALATKTQASEFTSDTHVNTMSCLSVDELEFLTTSIKAESGLVGLGESLAQAEAEYGVNALFILAVASHESYYGRSNAAQTRNNLFGIMQRGGGQVVYPNKQNSVLGFARLISGRIYFEADRTTPAQINSKYAPNTPDWTPQVVELMNKYSQNLSEYAPPEPPVVIIDDVLYSETPAVIERPVKHFPPPPPLSDPAPDSPDAPEHTVLVVHLSADPLTKRKKYDILEPIEV
ncbi:MAG: glucosaminidase domain-containing protein [Oscillospiraceae bacterium]|nr:glucosaminidase domain-containing protein [Oscillospiraceae bacterium]